MLNALTQQVADALERSRLFEEMEMAREQMNMLYVGSERLVRANSIEEVLSALVESTELRHMDRASMFFFDKVWDDVAPETMTVTAVWEKRNLGAGAPVGTTLPLSQMPSLQLVNKYEPAIFSDILADERVGADAKMLAEQYGVTSVMFFPLVIGDQWIGIVMVQSVNAHKLTEDNIRQITGLVDQAASVSQSQRLFTQTQARARREQLLREVGAKVYAAPNAETILKTAAKEVNRIMGVDAFVYLDDPSDQKPIPTNGHSLAAPETTGQEG
jgi:GAF domain-containing protein